MALPGTLRRRGVPGTMQASSPTEVRYNAGFPFGRGPSVGRRGGIYCARRRVSEANRRAAAALGLEIPPAGVCAAAGCGGMRASRPTVARAAAWPSRLAGRARGACTGGPCPSRTPRAAANRADMASAPAGVAFPRLAAVPAAGAVPAISKPIRQTRPRACQAGPGARFCSAFCFNAPGIRPRGRRGCGGLSRGCRSCARRCAAAARRAAKR